MKTSILIFATLWLIAPRVTAADFPKAAIEFVDKHCAECHDDQTAGGGFRIDLLRTDLADQANHKLWARVLARVQNGEMPPAIQKDRLTSAERAVALQPLRLAFQEQAKADRGGGGRVRTRRLNRLEYENTVRELLDVHTPLQDLLPEDDLADGFSNNTGALSISPVHIQQYMAAADRALQDATVRRDRPETKTHRFSYTHEDEKPFHGHAHNKLQCNLRGEDLHFFLPTHIEVPAYLRQFEKLTRQTPGRYRIRITTEAHHTTDGEDLAYSVWIAAGGKRRELIGYFDAPFNKPTSIELTRYFQSNETIIIAPYRMAKIRTDAGYSVYLPDKKENIPEGWHHINNPNPPIATVGPAIVIKPVEITGPLLASWPPEGHRLLYGDAELVPVAEVAKTSRVTEAIRRNQLTVQPTNDDATKTQLSTYMSRAFRRPASAEEVDRYYALVRTRLDQGECFEVSMNAAHRAVLCSPHFLFLVEDEPLLNDFELASRLSYFLWRTSPDAALRDLAAKGELSKPDVLRRETERLISSPRFEAFIDDFLDHWLNLREIEATTPDRDLFPEYFVSYHDGRQDGLLHESIVGETRAFVRDLVARDLGIERLVKSPDMLLNQRLAEHYELPPVKGTQLRRVTLPAESVRGGLLTQASVLKVTANGASTSPVVRGVWILERILGTPAPPPPPNAGSIEPDTRGATTIREQLAKHKANKNCAGCHQKIDPPGFALESFDPVGRFREFYRTTETGEKLDDARTWYGSHYGHVKYLKGDDVDSSSVLPDDTAVSGIRAYKDILAEKQGQIARNFIGKLVTYSTGVHTEPGDALAIDSILKRAEPKKFGLKTLIIETVQSELFTHK
jgi:mono/diheme cytochrome c family protein